MKANPYHPDWKNYTGKDRGVGSDVVKRSKRGRVKGDGFIFIPLLGYKLLRKEVHYA
jgi:hypothetical protein